MKPLQEFQAWASVGGRAFDRTFALLLGLLLVAVAYPCLAYPPISDSWEMFYFFHHVGSRPGGHGWLHIFNHDPYERIRFQPFSRLYYYSFFRLFGTDLSWINAANLLVYWAVLLQLYAVAGLLQIPRAASCPLLLLLAFSFNHFDMVLWSSHIYVLGGMGLVLWGWMRHIRYLQTGRTGQAWAGGALMLSGLFCYEAFWLWPAAVFALNRLQVLRTASSPSPRRADRTSALVLAAMLAAALAMFFWTRWLGTYTLSPAPPRQLADFFHLRAGVVSALLTAFNLAYNQVCVRVLPGLAFPLNVSENVYMRGHLLPWLDGQGAPWLFAAGVLALAAAARGARALLKNGLRQEALTLGLLLGMAATPPLIIFFCRCSTNDLCYGCTEFRYQFPPNAFVTLAAAFALARWRLPVRRAARAGIYAAVFALVLGANLRADYKLLDIYRRQLTPLITLISDIRLAMADGRVTQQKRLYVAPDLPDFLPNLCWNIDMGQRFMDGSYQWMFGLRDIASLTGDPAQAAWDVDRQSLRIAPMGSAAQDARRVNAIRSPDYIDSPRDRHFLELAHQAAEDGHPDEAARLVRRALAFNPDSREVLDFQHDLASAGADRRP